MGYSIPDTVTTKGPFQPMRFEATVEECIVTHGEIPRDLSGGIYRTGPCWKRPTSQGTTPLLAMDGMVQGLVFENGRADFRNRWVRTPKYMLEDRYGRGMFEYSDGGFGDYRDYGYGEVLRTTENAHTPQGTASINIFPFAGELIVSGELGPHPRSSIRSRWRPRESYRGHRNCPEARTSRCASATAPSALTRNGMRTRAFSTGGHTATPRPMCR